MLHRCRRNLSQGNACTGSGDPGGPQVLGWEGGQRHQASAKALGNDSRERPWKKTLRVIFAPVVSSDALMGPFLLTAPLFMTGIFVFYVLSEIAKAPSRSLLIDLAVAIQVVGVIPRVTTFIAPGVSTVSSLVF